jgi:hypothetical protein
MYNPHICVVFITPRDLQSVPRLANAVRRTGATGIPAAWTPLSAFRALAAPASRDQWERFKTSLFKMLFFRPEP